MGQSTSAKGREHVVCEKRIGGPVPFFRSGALQGVRPCRTIRIVSCGQFNEAYDACPLRVAFTCDFLALNAARRKRFCLRRRARKFAALNALR